MEKKKLPTDYPMFSFRISLEDKARLGKLIGKAVKLSNANREEDDFIIRKNDIIIEALEEGLRRIIKKRS